jgi:aldehyde:ferredoxin oxidoreductase
MIAWLMDCFEHNVVDERQLGFSIRFGDAEQVCQLIENIALRRGVGANLLADGVLKAVRILGETTRPYLRASRGIGLPAHMPRKKPGVGFGYFHGPNPADHMKLEHDWLASDPDMLKDFGLEISSEPEALDENKVEIARATQIYYSLADVLSLCMFVFGPGNLFTFDEITDLVNAATGLNLTFSDLMQLGERSVQLQRELYVATGGEDEKFPEFLETEIPAGPSQGQRITRSDFEKARAHYYDLWNWDSGRAQPAPE